MGRIGIKQIYRPVSPTDGVRILVDRLWPRGVSKAKAGIDVWLKDVAPSTELRQWFGHSPERWLEFRARYLDELNLKPQFWEPILQAAREDDVTLLFSARDTQHNNAVVLGEFLDARLRGA